MKDKRKKKERNLKRQEGQSKSDGFLIDRLCFINN